MVSPISNFGITQIDGPDTINNTRNQPKSTPAQLNPGTSSGVVAPTPIGIKAQPTDGGALDLPVNRNQDMIIGQPNPTIGQKYFNEPKPEIPQETMARKAPISSGTISPIIEEQKIQRAAPVSQRIASDQPKPISQDEYNKGKAKAQEQLDAVKQKEELKFQKEKIQQDLVESQKSSYDKFAQFFADLADPTKSDPVKDASFNYYISTVGRNNASQINDLTMKLKQSGVDTNGPGAGMAMLMALSRDQNANLSDVVGKLNVESANRLIEANKYGLENFYKKEKHDAEMKAMNFNQTAKEIEYRANVLQTENPEDYTDLFARMNLPDNFSSSNFIQSIKSANAADRADAFKSLSADYKGIADTIDTMIPGLPFDPVDLSKLNTEDQGSVFSELTKIDKLLQNNDKAGAKELLLDLQRRYPGVFDSDYTNWDPDVADVQGANNSYKYHMGELADRVFTAGDSEMAKESNIDYAAQFLVKEDKVDSQFDALSKASDYQKQEIAKMAGFDSFEEIDTFDEKKRVLAAEMVRSINYNTDQVQLHMDNMLKNDPNLKAWVLESPENSDAMRMYVDTLLRGEGTIDANGNYVIDPSKLVPPTNINSDKAYMVMDWPFAFDENGKFIQQSDWGSNPSVYTGNNLIGENVNYQTYGKDATSWDKYQDEVTKQWKIYKESMGGELNRMEWFQKSEGGTKSVSVSKDEKPLVLTTKEKVAENIKKLVGGQIKTNDILNDRNFWDEIASPADPTSRNELIKSGKVKLASDVQSSVKTNIDNMKWAIEDFVAGKTTKLPFKVANVTADGQKKVAFGKENADIVIYEGKPYILDELIYSRSSEDSKNVFLQLQPLSGDNQYKPAIIHMSGKYVNDDRDQNQYNALQIYDTKVS